MSMSQEQIRAMMAAAKAKAEEAKARALANAAILQQRAQQQQQQQQQAGQLPPTAASASGGAAARGGEGLSQLELIRQKKEALQAKLNRVIPAASAGQTAASSSGSRPAGAGVGGTTAAASGQRTTTVKGGLGMDMAPGLSRDAEGNLIINSVTAGKSVKTPSFATAKVNQKPEPKKELKILGVPEEFTNPEKNPYFDENLAAAPRERRSRPLKFAQQGKYINIANQIRSDQRAVQMRREIEEAAKANIEEDDQQIKDGFTKREVLKGVEWWDAGFLPNKTYDDIKDGHARIETEDDPLITHYIQHPVPIEPPNEAAQAASAKPRPLMLTTKERKRLRRQRRAELLKEKQDKIRLGLLPPDAPKVKLANMMRVLGQEAVLNPTEIEMKVRQQVADRLQEHLDHNAAAKLTHDQRKAKESKKKEEDVAKGIYVSLYKINDLSHPQKKFKVDKNATQLGLTGIVLMYPTFSIVLVEGGHKAINQYKKLMLRRIDWSDNTRLDGTEVSETTIDNKCLLVWEGQLRERQFKTFRFLKATNDAQLKQVLVRHGVQHYWDQALGFKEEDMLGAEVTL